MKNYLSFALFAALVIALAPMQAGALTGENTSTATGTKDTKQYTEEMLRLRQEKAEAAKKDAAELLRQREALMLQKKASTTDPRIQIKNTLVTATSVRPELKDKIKDVGNEARENIKEVRANAQIKVKELREEFRDRVGELRKSRIEAYLERTVRRLEAAFERLTKLGDRVEDRIIKLDEVNQNFDPTRPNELLGIARTKISEGKALIAQLPTQFTGIFTNTATSSTPQTELAQVKSTVEKITSAARSAHAALVDVIVSIKAQTGTSTPPTTGTSTATTTVN